MVIYDGKEVKDLYVLVFMVYENIGFVIFYVVFMVVIGYYLVYGFQLVFQMLGINYCKYILFIQGFGKVYVIFILFGFVVIFIVMYFRG